MIQEFIKKKIIAIEAATPGYVAALASGYLLIAVATLSQFLLTPFYLQYLGTHQFGVLMMLLSMFNLAAFGITWVTGGLVRVLGENWAKKEIDGFVDAFAVGKYICTLYAIALAGFVVVGWYAGHELGVIEQAVPNAVLWAACYFIILYENTPERQAFLGTNRQATINYIELGRIAVFILLTFILLPVKQNVEAVLLAMVGGILAQRLGTGFYWSRQLSGIGWRKINSNMTLIFKRLVSRQGAGYVSYGVLLLILQADTLLIGYLGGAEMAGQFVLLWKIPEALALILWRVPSSIEPRVIHLDASANKEQLYSLFSVGRRWFVLLTFVVAVVYILLGKWVTELWVGDHAPKDQWMYVLAGIAMFFNVIARWPISFAYALVKLGPLTRNIFIEVVCKLVLTVLMFEHIAIAAPIAASIITHVFYASISYQRLITLEGKSL